MINNKFSSRERVRTALNHQTTDRIPIGMICGNINEPALNKLNDYLLSTRGISAKEYIDSFLDLTEINACGGYDNEKDIWGVERKNINYGEGSYNEISFYPLKEMNTIEEINKYSFPKVTHMNADEVVEQITEVRRSKDTAIVLTNANLFETLWYMRGFENAMMDMMLQPEFIHTIMGKVTDFFIEYFYKILAKSKDDVDLVFTADDIGQQEGLLLSLEMWEEFIKPYHVRLNDMIHNMNTEVIYHTDGSITEAVPGLIDMGIDVLQALQFSANNMDPIHLKDNFGNDLCFEGGMCVQKILPFGTRDEVIDETRKLITVLGNSGGYICGPSHYIQSGTPPENITAFFDEATNFYPFDN
ncbi:MAG: uroporphyrinogen decarboxylase family protein [Melioribacteraceae bacterium]|nr:uroporphyrinogen decarboxylase family protein [Melioribacteraceae bacterium]